MLTPLARVHTDREVNINEAADSPSVALACDNAKGGLGEDQACSAIVRSCAQDGQGNAPFLYKRV